MFAFIHASIHNNLSAGAQNVTGAYVIMLVYRRLLTMRLHGKAAIIIIIIHLVTTMTRYVQKAKPVGVQPNYKKINYLA